MRENEEIFGPNNELLENGNVENNESFVEQLVEKENANPVLNSVFPDYNVVVEPEEPNFSNSFEESNVEEKSQNFDIEKSDENIELANQIEENIEMESIENNNVVGENVVEITEEVVNPLIPNYSESVEPVMPVEEVVEPTEVNNVFGENVVETTEEVINPLIPDYSESVEPLMPVEEVVVEESEVSTQETKETNYNPMEHPDARIVLNKNVDVAEEEKVDPEIENMKVMNELKSNKSLMFVLVLGVILFIVVLVLPYFSELLG